MMKQRISFILLSILLISGCNQKSPTDTPVKPRVIVLTDVSSISQNAGEPDDGQSLIRLLLYSNDLKIEGLLATSTLQHGYTVKPDLIRKLITEYGKVRPNLIKHDPEYPTAENLLKLVHAGIPLASPEMDVFKMIGNGRDTDASEWIIKTVDRESPEKLWIIIWGGSADLAQALWKIRNTRTPEKVNKFISKIRVDAVADQDATGPWIRATFPNLYYIAREYNFRGMYRGGDTSLVRSAWVNKYIHHHGALSDMYVDYRGGDIWYNEMGAVTGIKEGDSPTILSLMLNGLNHSERLWGGWGGRFITKDGNTNVLVDAVDSIGDFKTDPNASMATVYRWRSAWQADFASRLDWCIKNYDEANHPPKLSLLPEYLDVQPGENVELHVKDLVDPDGDSLTFKWFYYPEAGNIKESLPQLNYNGETASFIAPDVVKSSTIHVIMEVTDSGSPALTRYRRHIITIHPKK